MSRRLKLCREITRRTTAEQGVLPRMRPGRMLLPLVARSPSPARGVPGAAKVDETPHPRGQK